MEKLLGRPASPIIPALLKRMEFAPRSPVVSRRVAALGNADHDSSELLLKRR
jgi:hypothetical protein